MGSLSHRWRWAVSVTDGDGQFQPQVEMGSFSHKAHSYRCMHQDVLSSVPWVGFLGLYQNSPLSYTPIRNLTTERLLTIKEHPSLPLILLFLSVSNCICFCPCLCSSLWRIMGWNNKCWKLQVFQMEEFHSFNEIIVNHIYHFWSRFSKSHWLQIGQSWALLISHLSCQPVGEESVCQDDICIIPEGTSYVLWIRPFIFHLGAEKTA